MMVDAQMFFDGWAPIVRTLVLGALSYIFLVVLLRVSGKRTLSKMNSFDFIVTVAFGSTLASVLTSQQVSLVQGAAALATLVGLQFLVTFVSVRFKPLANLVKARPQLLFYHGIFIDEEMRRERITKEEVLASIRESGKGRVREIDAVVLETNGTLSVIKNGVNSADDLEQLGISTPDILQANEGRTK